MQSPSKVLEYMEIRTQIYEFGVGDTVQPITLMPLVPPKFMSFLHAKCIHLIPIVPKSYLILAWTLSPKFHLNII